MNLWHAAWRRDTGIVWQHVYISIVSCLYNYILSYTGALEAGEELLLKIMVAFFAQDYICVVFGLDSHFLFIVIGVGSSAQVHIMHSTGYLILLFISHFYKGSYTA